MADTRGEDVRRKRDAKPPEGELRSAADQLRAALSELATTPTKDTPKQRHVDDYREFSVDKRDDSPLSQALFELTQDAYQRRHRLAPEEPPTVPLGEDRDATTPQRLADKVTGEMSREMKRLGLTPPTHYYSASERRETGEVDRTYDVGKKPRTEPKPRRRR